MIEVFCSELPAQCNVYLSGKQSATRRRASPHCRHPRCGKKATSPLPLLRFATDRHSLTLLQERYSEKDNGSNQGREGDDYSLSVSRLPSPSSSYSGDDKSKKSSYKKESTGRKNNDREENCDICLAHSSVFGDGGPPRAYQVDFNVVNCGKFIASSKQRIQFKFGYFHGSEHEVIVAWSFTSGKQTIEMDGKEIFNSNGGDSPKHKLQHSWLDETGIHLEVYVHASPGSLQADPDWRQHDFLIDGTSFFQWPKNSELGDEEYDCQYLESSVEVFAMTRTPSIAENDAKEQKQSDNNSLITHGSHSLPEAGHDGGDMADHKPVEAAMSSTKNDPGGDDGKIDKHNSPSNYYLTVKSKVLLEQIYPEKKALEMNVHSSEGVLDSGSVKPKIKTHVEIVPLDFRPMSVHVTELHISTDAKRNDYSSLSCCSAIGVFVASVDDNKLRFYVTRKERLHNTTEPCFFPLPLCDTSPVSGVHGRDELGDDPLVFSSPVMAMDTCVTDEEWSENLHSDREKSLIKVNRLAVACYDGTVNILTYQLKVQNPNSNSNDSALQFCHLRSSVFIVDGPVVSLHFGLPLPRSSPLFLVAGSLCGFACVFYESLQSSSNHRPQNGSTPFFDGPLTVVDGLYDARQEGYEDCVTSVHVCCDTRRQSLIAVGTQGGRVLLFQQCGTEENAWNESEDQAVTAQQEKDEFASKIVQIEKEISRLLSEQEGMKGKVRALNEVVSEMQRKIEGLATALQTKNTDSLQLSLSERGDTANDADVDECLDERTIVSRGNDGEETTHNEKSNFESKLKSARTELILLEQQKSDHASKIAELTSTAEDHIRRGRVQITNEMNSDSIHIEKMMRKKHRYKLLWEYHLPYPIHGITSSAHQNKEGGSGILLFVSTRRSLHVFRDLFPDVDTVMVDKSVAS